MVESEQKQRKKKKHENEDPEERRKRRERRKLRKKKELEKSEDEQDRPNDKGASDDDEPPKKPKKSRKKPKEPESDDDDESIASKSKAKPENDEETEPLVERKGLRPSQSRFHQATQYLTSSMANLLVNTHATSMLNIGIRLSKMKKAERETKLQLKGHYALQFTSMFTDDLPEDPYIVHPMLRIHLVDISTGRYLNKEKNERLAVNQYENTTDIPIKGSTRVQSICKYVLPIMICKINFSVAINLNAFSEPIIGKFKLQSTKLMCPFPFEGMTTICICFALGTPQTVQRPGM